MVSQMLWMCFCHCMPLANHRSNFEDKEGDAPVDIKTFEEKEEQTGSRSHSKEDMLEVGAPCVLQGLFDSSKNGQTCTILKLPTQGDDGRCVVQMSGSKLAVKLANLRPLQGENESDINYSARVLGLTPSLGLDGRPTFAKEVLSAALRSAQRDLPEAPDALLESQQAFDRLSGAISSQPIATSSISSQPIPPHAFVEQGLLGRRAAEAATNAANQQSMKIAESGLSALRQLLNDEHRRQAREVGLEWPLPSSSLSKLPSEGPDALRLRLTLVRALLRCHQDSQAVLEAEACVRRHPRSAASLLYAARCLLRLGRREQGLKYLSAALDGATGPDHTWGHQGASIRLQSFETVEKCKLAAEDAYAYGDFPCAALRYGDALTSCPQDDKWGRATLHAARAACHRRARDFRQAIDDCDSALALFPKYARALFRRAACLLEAGRPKEAVQTLETLLRVDRKWPNLCDWLVRAHAQVKRMEKDDRYKPTWKKGRGNDRKQQGEGAQGAPELSGSDLYSILGVSSDATDQQLKRAYRLMSLKYHPDKQGGSTRDFQRIAMAYETLSDPAKRHAYNDGADLNKKQEDSEDSDREEKSLREEVERILSCTEHGQKLWLTQHLNTCLWLLSVAYVDLPVFPIPCSKEVLPRAFQARTLQFQATPWWHSWFQMISIWCCATWFRTWFDYENRNHGKTHELKCKEPHKAHQVTGDLWCSCQGTGLLEIPSLKNASSTSDGGKKPSGLTWLKNA